MTTYSPGEVKKYLGIPSSTLRRYVARFGSYLSENANRRRGRRYTDNDIHILGEIRDLTEQGKRFDEIEPLLTKVKVTKKTKEEFTLKTISKRFDSMGETLIDQQRDINAMRGEIDHLKRMYEKMEQDRKKPRWKKWLGR